MAAGAAALFHFLAGIAAILDRIVDAWASGRSPADAALIAARRVGGAAAGIPRPLLPIAAH